MNVFFFFSVRFDQIFVRNSFVYSTTHGEEKKLLAPCLVDTLVFVNANNGKRPSSILMCLWFVAPKTIRFHVRQKKKIVC